MTDAVVAEYRQIVARLTSPGARFAYREEIVGGIPTRTYLGAPTQISEVYEQAAEAFGPLPLLREDGTVLTYAETIAFARRYAVRLGADHGLVQGDRIAIAMRNRPEWIVAFMAVTMAGAVAVLINGRGAPDELVHALAQIPCRFVIADARRMDRLKTARVAEALVAAPDLDGLAKEDEAVFSPVRVAPDSPAVILFTSGTTGRPKGVVLPQRAICHAAYNSLFLREVGFAVTAAAYKVDVATVQAMAPPMSSLLVFPLFHVSGLTTLFVALWTGGCITTLPRWDAGSAIRTIEDHGITLLSGPAMVLIDLLAQPDAPKRLQRIVNATVGGQATPASLSARLSVQLPAAQQGNGWGMTEISGSACAAAGPLFMARPSSCGPLFPVIGAKTVGPDGDTLGPGEIGELCVRGPTVMSGYFDAPEATADALRDGWLHTGDIGRIDADGFVYLIDRKKEMVISAGENIYCAEVERVVSSIDSLLEVAMFGVPDERLGERAVVAVNVAPGRRCTSEEVLTRARRDLADYKVPAEIVFDLGPFPRNALGKIDKDALRSAFLTRGGSC